MNNSRFTVAVHLLTFLAMGFEGVNTSEHMAGSVNTNPVVVRRIMGALRKAGLVTSQPGVGGGVALAQESETITLLDVYHAVEKDELFPLHPNPPHPMCPCGGNIQAVLKPVYEQAEAAMYTVLDDVTIAQMAADTWVKHQERAGAPDQ